MHPKAFPKVVAFFAALVLLPVGAHAAGGDVLMFHNDPASTGQYLTEPLLSATNVNSTNFGKLFTYSLDGACYTQPLYKSGVTITTGTAAGTVHNLVLVATENDSLYAFDADGIDGTTPLWQDSFINVGNNVTTVPQGDVSSTNISPVIGITGTPVIDSTTSTIFVVAKTKEIISGGTNYFFRLHAIDLGSGAEKSGSPTVIADTIKNGSAYTFVSGPKVSGTGDSSSSSTVTLNALKQNQRCALALVNNVVYIAFASHGDSKPYNGWVLGYSATNYQIVAAWDADPNGGDTGIWEGGGTVDSDTNGLLYIITGNGTFSQPSFDNTTSSYVSGNYGDSFVQLAVDTLHTSSTNQNSNGWGLKVTSYFSPFYQLGLSGSDKDLGSGAPLVLPASVGSVAHPNLVFGGGKQGTMYLVDRNNMGAFTSSSDAVVQEMTSVIPSCFSNPGYFNGVIYDIPTSSGSGAAIAISSGSCTLISHTPDTFGTHGVSGAIPVISGTSATDPNAVVWCMDAGNGSNQLRAYKASNFNTELYTSAQNSSRDSVGTTCKYTAPTVANTRVYVSTTNSLIAYGLFNAPPTVPPNAPSNLAAVALGTTSISVSWTNNTTISATGVAIEQSTNDSTFNQIASVSGTAVSYSATALSSGSNYFYRIREVNAVGPSPYAGPASATTFCVAPANPAAIGGSNVVSMAWTASAGAGSYNLYRATVSGSEGNTAYKTGIALTSSSDTAVTNGTTYYYTVAAVNASGAGPQSVEFSATPSANITISEWKLQEFGSVAAAESVEAGDTADPAGDGISNLMKYALGLNPFVDGVANLPGVAVENIGGTNYLTLTFVCPNPQPTDITYNVETNTDLSNTWTPATLVPGYPVDNGNGTETVKEQSVAPETSLNEFIRLRVTGP